MLRSKQHPMPAAILGNFSPDSVHGELRIAVLADLLDMLDLQSFLLDPACRHRLNEVLACFSDEEFDSFERLYSRRFTVN
jgi:hypothetical protein